MSRRIAALTLDTLDDLPKKCRRCIFWELDPIAGDRAKEAGDTAFEKEAWASANTPGVGELREDRLCRRRPRGPRAVRPTVSGPSFGGVSHRTGQR